MNILKLLLFSVLQISLVFFYIYSRSTITKLSYLKQKNEKKYTQLYEQNIQLVHTIEKCKDPVTLRQEAIQQGMVPLRLRNISRLENVCNYGEQP